jgi:putative glutamine amidotransferase
MKPVIGMAWPKPDYVASLERAGATVKILDAERDRLPGALDECDGILLTGGADVDPREYGDAPDPTVQIDAARDAYELPLARLAIERDVPLLAICRGVQVLNVAAGGTLIQDIPSQHPTSTPHSLTEASDLIAHDVAIAPGTCLSVLVGQPRAAVNSRHHQSVKDAAPGFVVAATSPDGVIEAIERPASSFCVGVQWHPENFWKQGTFSGLFDGLVRSAAERREHLDVRGVGKQVEGA